MPDAFLLSLFVVILAGVVAMPRYGLRLLLAGILLGLTFNIYTNMPYRPGLGYQVSIAMLMVPVLLFAALTSGLLLTLRLTGVLPKPTNPALAPTPLDPWLAGFAMVPFAGLLMLEAGSRLAGSATPLRDHLTLLAISTGLAVVGIVRLSGLAKGATLGMALSIGLITLFSLTMERSFTKDLRQKSGSAACLMAGPAGAPLTLPLMALTAPKPILLVSRQDGVTRVYRWSFRYAGFVRTTPADTVKLCPVQALPRPRPFAISRQP